MEKEMIQSAFEKYLSLFGENKFIKEERKKKHVALDINGEKYVVCGYATDNMKNIGNGRLFIHQLESGGFLDFPGDVCGEITGMEVVDGV